MWFYNGMDGYEFLCIKETFKWVNASVPISLRILLILLMKPTFLCWPADVCSSPGSRSFSLNPLGTPPCQPNSTSQPWPAALPARPLPVVSLGQGMCWRGHDSGCLDTPQRWGWREKQKQTQHTEFLGSVMVLTGCLFWCLYYSITCIE